MLNKIKNFIPKEIEEEVLKFWTDSKIFEKSVNKTLRQAQGKKQKSYVFFDGPPFATGLPHYGHILASIIKDAIPRYQTMKGYKVERKWGWDCHGLPVENVVEQDLGLKSKKDIEKIGIDKFNQAAKNRVLSYAGDWKKIIPRIGRWVDMENDYKTMDSDYTESVFWIFKNLYDKGLVYKGYKSMHICPRCGTTLSNFEVTQNYKDIDDISVFVKAEVVGEPGTFLVAWTTTPWTLPGNVALAVNKNLNYVKVKIIDQKFPTNELYILAKERLSSVLAILGVQNFEIVETIKGKDLVGKQYKPIFDYYHKDKSVKNHENGWKVTAGDFVTAEDGTGIVHIAPAFGEDDMKLAQKENLPFVQHVAMDGRFKPEVNDFLGLYVKPKDNPQQTDVEVLKWLAHNDKLFAKQKISHSYPHCWRCDTPLLNYATGSWFVRVTDLKNAKGGLLDNNKKINWVPKYVGEGRFGNWLADARDWAVSRSRFWGAPLPIWKCNDCKEIKVIGSADEIKNNVKSSGNGYFVMRHGQSETNAKGVVNSDIKHNHFRLTGKGKKEVIATAKKLKKELKNKNIDVIFSSDFERARETAELMADGLGLPKSKIIFDASIREVNTGIFDGKKPKAYHAHFKSLEEKFYKNPPEGENLIELKNRVTGFLYEIEDKYKNKNILIVSHEYPAWLMLSGAMGADVKKSLKIRGNKEDFIKTGEVIKLDFAPIPHNENFELDFHRPYIDEVEFSCSKCKGAMKRIPDVFDCWFESGAMPYAQVHYPFENKKKFEQNFPAEFIAEGIDQTRGWFYTLLVLSSGLFNKSAFKNVVVNGIILAEDGQKMSKRLKNYPDPMEVVNKYGADALRLYLLSSPVVHAENLNFSEKGVDELYKKTILRLWNVFNFYNTYADKKKTNNHSSASWRATNILDKWILARLNQSITDITKAMENYELDKAAKPVSEFVDDLSTWYVRRSRRRLQKPESKEDYKNASKTLGFVLSEFSKLTAPFIPFIAEALYKSLNGKSSVHLESWPVVAKGQAGKGRKLVEEMEEVRKLAATALAERAKLGIKVRQPLASLKIKSEKLKVKCQKELFEILGDEINVKEIKINPKITGEIELDAIITPKLKTEGILRDFVRTVQDLRQEAGLNPKDTINLYIEAPQELELAVNENIASLKKETGSKNIEFKKTNKFDAEISTKFESREMWVGIKKI